MVRNVVHGSGPSRDGHPGHGSMVHEMRDPYGKTSSYRADSEMISEDHSAPCNLPRHVIEKAYGVAGAPLSGQIGSLYTGVQRQLHQDAAERNRITRPSKY